jgi:hypothetical protein
LEFAKNEAPTDENAIGFRATLQDKALSASTINNYCFAIKKYFEMHGQSVDFNFIKPMNMIPHFFDENDIYKLFSVCCNLKHFAMLQCLFFGWA